MKTSKLNLEEMWRMELHPKIQGKSFDDFSVTSNNLTSPGSTALNLLSLISSFILFLPRTDCFRWVDEIVAGASLDVSIFLQLVNVLSYSMHGSQAGWILSWQCLRILPTPRLVGKSSFYLSQYLSHTSIKVYHNVKVCAFFFLICFSHQNKSSFRTGIHIVHIFPLCTFVSLIFYFCLI